MKSLFITCFAVFYLAGCQPNVEQSDVSSSEDKIEANEVEQQVEEQYEEIEWIALMPPEDLDALLNPPSYVTDVVDGSIEDQIASQVQNSLAAAFDDKYQQALTSTNVVEAMDGAKIKLPGFIVPLEFDDQQRVIQFFLVPYFGACLHLPPPPPNQIVFVNYPKGLEQHVLEQPFWISGELVASIVNNDMATAAYSMDNAHVEPYDEE